MDTNTTEDDPVAIGPMRDFISDRRLEPVAAKQTTEVLFWQPNQIAETVCQNKENIFNSNEDKISVSHNNNPDKINELSCMKMEFKERELSLNPLFDETLIGMSIQKQDGQFLKVNSFLCKMLGYSAQELSSQNIKNIIDDIDWEKTVQILKKWNPGEKRNTMKRTHAIHKDGYQIPIMMNLAVILNDRGEISGYLLQSMPISGIEKPIEKIRQYQDDREELLKEIHHRVKNNLQVISSLLNLQSRLVKDPKTVDLFKISQDRIHSMALVHEKLYESSNFKNVDFAGYIHSLFESLRRTYYQKAKNIFVKVNMEEIILPIDIAIPCGLILNELLSNAIKHAFSKTSIKRKKIEIGLQKISENLIELKVRDNGVGMPKDFRLKQKESLGLSLVSFLSEDQLQGHIELSRRRIGTEFTIRFQI